MLNIFQNVFKKVVKGEKERRREKKTITGGQGSIGEYSCCTCSGIRDTVADERERDRERETITGRNKGV